MLNALTIDVEDYYQVSAFESVVSYEDWDQFESRVERNTYKILAILSDSNVKATFFILGWVAECYPGIVKAIRAQGHEIASHGYNHKVLTAMTPEQFREDIRRAKGLLEDISGVAVLGYRAPSFTIVQDTIWALPILVEEGYVYDCSIFPIRHDRYGMPGANPNCHCLFTDAGPLWEIPPSTIQIAGIRVPIAGGGYFRLFPYPVLRKLLKSVETGGRPLVMYLHPWEIDPDQPRMHCSLLSYFRQYFNLHKTEARLIALLRDFRFAPIRDAFETVGRLPRERTAEGIGGHMTVETQATQA